jgi:hypothetical protein
MDDEVEERIRECRPGNWQEKKGKRRSGSLYYKMMLREKPD